MDQALGWGGSGGSGDSLAFHPRVLRSTLEPAASSCGLGPVSSPVWASLPS